MSTASFVAISNAPHNSPCGKSIRSFANWSTTAISSTSEPRSQKMNLIELNRALGQLRLGGIAAVLETRLHQAQTEAMPRSTSSPASSPTNSLVVASDCWSEEKNRPSSATLTKLSITSTSTSTEK